MSVSKRLQRIKRTLEFLERDEVGKENRRIRRAQRREENRHLRDVVVVDAGRPVTYWHWKVYKNTCDHGYLYIKTPFRIKVSHVTHGGLGQSQWPV